jgi:hypothetical protein
MGHSRRFPHEHATSGYPPKLTLKADLPDGSLRSFPAVLTTAVRQINLKKATCVLLVPSHGTLRRQSTLWMPRKSDQARLIIKAEAERIRTNLQVMA